MASVGRVRGSAFNSIEVCFKWNQIGSHSRGIQAFCDVLKDTRWHHFTCSFLRNNIPHIPYMITYVYIYVSV